MENQIESTSNVSEFALPGRMRELANRIFLDLIDACRHQLADADKERKDVIDPAEIALASAKATIDFIRKHVDIFDPICQTAEKHLKSVGASLPTIKLLDHLEPDDFDDRTIANRIFLDLIDACRHQLADADKERKDVIDPAEIALASAEATIDFIREHVDIFEPICQTAEKHLKSVGVSLPTIELLDHLEPDDFDDRTILKTNIEATYHEATYHEATIHKHRIQTKARKPDALPGLDKDSIEGVVSREIEWVGGFCKEYHAKPKYVSKYAVLNLFTLLWIIGWLISVTVWFNNLFVPEPKAANQNSGFVLVIIMILPLIFLFMIRFFMRNHWVNRIHSDYEGLVRRSQKLRLSLRALEDRMIPPAKEIHSNTVKAANQRFDTAFKKIKDDFSQVAEQLHDDVNLLWKDSGFAAKEWDSSEWKEWLPDASPEFATRIGTFTISADDLQSRLPEVQFDFKLPALIPFADDRCLLLNSRGEVSKRASEALQSTAIRALANTPPGKARFTLIDPVGLGQNVGEFMHLGDFNRDLINGKAWTEPQHIEEQLTKLTEDMETVIQTFLRKKYATIQEYNKEHNEVAEPYRFLIIFDFPVNFTASSARRLVSIVKNGPRCGVYTMILMDSSKKLPYDFEIDELRQAVCINESLSKEGSRISRFVWEEQYLKGFTLHLDRLPPQDVSHEIMKKSGEMSAEGMKKEVPFEKLIATTQKKDSWLCSSTAEQFSVPIGPAGMGKPQELTLGGGQEAHALLVGRTGSGKTNLMHVIITNLALTYSPNELQLFLIDFKGGVGFKRYAQHQLPHAKVIAIESEREFGMSVLRGLDAELKRRSEIFRAAEVDNLAAYRASCVQNGTVLPRILLVVDEFQEFFSESDESSQQAKTIFDRLARQGRSFGLHFLLATQSLSGAAQLPTSIMGQIKVRIALPCSEADSRLILADDNKAARSLSLPGEAIYNPMGGLVEGNNPFQVARFNADIDLQKYLKMVSRMAHDQQISAKPIIFEGNELARAEECEPLKELLSATDWPQPVKGIDLFLGEPIAIQPPVAARLRRQSGSNLMILTRDESEGIGMCVSVLLSILAQKRPGTSRVYIVDFTIADSEWAEHAEEIERRFPGKITVIGRQNESGSMFATIAEEVRLRSGDNTSEQVSVFLILQGMHRIKSLREDIADDNGNNSVELLQTILRDGPEVGVHVIAWADTLDNALRGVSRKTIKEFGLRVGAAMNSGDSMNFLDDMAASKISKPHRAIFADEDRPGQLVTFRPYAMPTVDWLGQTGQLLHARIES